jgi:hypothetical protein
MSTKVLKYVYQLKMFCVSNEINSVLCLICVFLKKKFDINIK